MQTQYFSCLQSLSQYTHVFLIKNQLSSPIQKWKIVRTCNSNKDLPSTEYGGTLTTLTEMKIINFSKSMATNKWMWMT